MKYLGVDFGSKKIGLAKSDESATFAFPLTILKNSSHIAQETMQILEKEGISEVVIGKSLDLSGHDNKIEVEVTLYIEELKTLNPNITIYRFDERFTTSGSQAVLRSTFIQSANSKQAASNAKAIRKHTKDDDAQTAAYMLQGFLDMKRGV
jgi:putative Holliday junction resolvase